VPIVPEVTVVWLVDLVNEYGSEPRAVAGEQAAPYPKLPDTVGARLARRDLVRIADELWPVFAPAKLERRAAALNGLLAAASLTPSVDAAACLCWATPHTEPAARLAAGCAATLVTAVGDHGWDRLGTCACGDCVDVYVDDQRRRARRYCSTTCLNRARVRAHRARHQAR